MPCLTSEVQVKNGIDRTGVNRDGHATVLSFLTVNESNQT
jgi:hypothetical protein